MIVTPPWLKVSHGELGIKEIPGPGDHPRIVEYHQYTTLKANHDDISWCSAVQNFCMAKALGFDTPEAWLAAKIPGTGGANARSWLKFGVALEYPAYGAICVLWRESPSSWKGHVGQVVQVSDTRIWLEGGNQSNEHCVRDYPLDRVLGYRWR